MSAKSDAILAVIGDHPEGLTCQEIRRRTRVGSKSFFALIERLRHMGRVQFEQRSDGRTYYSAGRRFDGDGDR